MKDDVIVEDDSEREIRSPMEDMHPADIDVINEQQQYTALKPASAPNEPVRSAPAPKAVQPPARENNNDINEDDSELFLRSCLSTMRKLSERGKMKAR